MTRIMLFVSFFLGMCGPAVSTSLWAISPEIIEAAKREGEMVWYGGGSGKEDDAVGEGFTKKYPTIRAKKFRIQSQNMIARFEAESVSGKHVADIVRTTDWYVYVAKQKGLLMKYDSPERKYFGPEFKDSEGYYTALWKYLHVIAYNTTLVPKTDVPRSYQDLLDPKWKGKIGFVDPVSASGITWFVNQLRMRGEKEGLEFMKKLAAQDISLRSSPQLLASLVAAGELPIALDLYGYQVEQLKKRGAPINFVALEPAVVHTLYGGISKYAPHPNAAKLFMDYLLSEEGQRIYLSFDFEVTRQGLYPAWFPKGVKQFVSDPQMDGERFNRYQKMFRDVFAK
jgi:iron(III) transport system substrate-binding protein